VLPTQANTSTFLRKDPQKIHASFRIAVKDLIDPALHSKWLAASENAHEKHSVLEFAILNFKKRRADASARKHHQLVRISSMLGKGMNMSPF
jgi:hypothetical protein